MPFYPFFGEGSPTKIDYKKMGTLILASLLEELVIKGPYQAPFFWALAWHWGCRKEIV